MTKLVETTELRKVYETGAVRCEALKGISLALASGDYVALMGHSGSGKSTLLHLVGGLDRPTSGQISVGGRQLANMNETELARFRRSHIGFVFQFFNLIDNLTVQANVELPALLNGRVNRGVVRRQAADLLGHLGISDHAQKYPWEMSGGQQQRAAIARALINRPALLLADEPTGNLDSASSQAVLRTLKACNEQGQTILIVTHDPRAASEAKQVLFIHDGRLVDTLPGGNAQAIARRFAALQ
ncbi:MAG: ABC transporter ATP-binding protein [Anaerolineae bacterium]